MMKREETHVEGFDFGLSYDETKINLSEKQNGKSWKSDFYFPESND